jgi:large repetitive protein
MRGLGRLGWLALALPSLSVGCPAFVEDRYVVRGGGAGADEPDASVAGGAAGESTGGAAGTSTGGASGQGGAGTGGSLLAYWRLDESAGSVAADASGNGNDVDLIGFSTPGWTTGRIDGALRFDGLTGWGRVNGTAIADAIVSANQFTIAAWVFRPVASADWAPIVSWQYQTTESEHLGLYVYEGVLRLQVNSQIYPGTVCRDPAAAPIGQWVHVAGTFDGVTCRAYLNGVEVCSVAGPQTLAADATPLIVGGNANDASGVPTELFLGRLDEVLIYGRPLSAAEIAGIAAGNPPPAG